MAATWGPGPLRAEEPTPTLRGELMVSWERAVRAPRTRQGLARPLLPLERVGGY